MRRIRQFLSVLLVLALVLSFLPMPARAAEETGDETVYRRVNNRLNGTSRTMHNTVRQDPLPESLDLSAYPTTNSEAAAQLRADLKAFDEIASVCIRTTEDDFWAVFDEIWAEAVAHTGDPTEGDYIDWQWIEYEVSCTPNSDGAYNYYAYEVYMTYATDAQKEAEMDAAVDTLLNDTLPLDASMSDYEKLKIVYDWVCENITYDHEHVYDDSYLPQFSAHAALVERTAVCQGYANLLYRLLLTLDIDTRFIGGYTDDGGPHAWNIVELDGVYYNVDSTWDAENAQAGWDYEWFLLSEASFVDHNRDPQYVTDEFWSAYPMAVMDYVHPGDSGTSPEPGPGPVEGGCGMSEADVYAAMIALQESYPEGMPWTNDNVYQWNINYTTGYGCAAFAFLLSDAAFGYLPSRTIYNFNNDVTIDDLRVGDILRLSNDSHSAVVLEIYDDYIVIAEGNFNASIHWGRTISADELVYDITYVETRYPEHSFAGGICTVCGAVDETEPEPEPDTWPKTGQCGDDVYWTLYEDGLLDLTGTGSTWDFPSEYPQWYEYEEMVRYAVIGNGITGIGDFFFFGCDALEWVQVDSSVWHLGKAAFGQCSALSEVDFLGSAPAFGEDVFSGTITTCFYPATDPSWTADVLHDHGGDVTWVPVGAGEPEDWVASGECGDDVSWVLTTDGLLVISGTGDMWNYPTGYPGWYDYADQVNYAIIDDGVTNIGDYFFWDAYNLLWVEVGPSVDHVGQCAFGSCNALIGVEFTGDAPAFMADAFYETVTAAYYPADNTTWTDDLLLYYEGFVDWYPSDAMDAPSLVVDEGQCGDDVYWTLYDDGMLAISGTGNMWDYPEEYPGWYAYMEDVYYAVVENGVTNIGDYFFCNCDNLMFVDVAPSVTYVGKGAIANAYSMIAVEFYGSAPAFADDVFYGTEATCYYPAGDPTWTADVMRDYSGSIEWEPSGDVDEPVEWPVSGQCGDDLYWTLDEGGLLTISGTGDMWDYPEEYPGWYAYVDSVVFAEVEDGVTGIGDFAFFDCYNLEGISLPASITRVGEKAFAYCTAMSSVVFTGNAPAIGPEAFYDVYAECVYPAGDATWTEDVMADYGGELTWVSEGGQPGTLPASGQCGDDVYWTLGEDGVLVISGTGSMWNYPVEYPGWYYHRDILTEAVVESGVTSIGDFAFYACGNLHTVTMPETITYIGISAFNGTVLNAVTIPEGVTVIGTAAFRGTPITSVTIPASVEKIESYAFEECASLTGIHFAGDAPTIEENAFLGVTAECAYPAGSDTWTADVMQNYGGSLTWLVPEEPGQAGDVNGTGSVDSDDAIYLLYHTLFGDALYPVSGDCDYNNDGSVDSDDAIYLLYYTLFGDALYPLN